MKNPWEYSSFALQEKNDLWELVIDLRKLFWQRCKLQGKDEKSLLEKGFTWSKAGACLLILAEISVRFLSRGLTTCEAISSTLFFPFTDFLRSDAIQRALQTFAAYID